MRKKIIRVSAVVIGVIVLSVGSFAGWFFYQLREMRPLKTAKLSDSVYVIKAGMGNLYLMKTNSGYVAFDAAEKPAEIIAACSSLSIEPSLVRAVFLTHSDADHVDGLPAFPSAAVYLSADEVPLLQDKTHRHFLGMEHMNTLPVAQYKTLSDGDSVEVDGIVVRAIATPGHTQGSLCYRVGGALFTGDLCLIVNDQVKPMVKIFTEDMQEDAESIKKIAGLSGLERIYTAHTGYTSDPEKALAQWR